MSILETHTVRKKLILIAVLAFCAMMLLDWVGVTGRRFPSNWNEALVQISINIGWTVFFTAVAYFVMMRPRRRRSSAAENQPSDSDSNAGRT